MNELPVRKKMRLNDYNYSQEGVFFITVCVKDKHEILGKTVGSDDPGAPSSDDPGAPSSDDPGAPYMKLSAYGNIVKKYVEEIEKHYPISIDKYIIMPNHVHMLIAVLNGAPRSSCPTMIIPRIVATLKKVTNREIGFNIWQTSYYDHVIRNNADYQRVWLYIDENPVKWKEDKYFLT